ncbi:hypothetical protein BJX64DRAFT_263754 [Aspergillus heterothallicus]
MVLNGSNRVNEFSPFFKAPGAPHCSLGTGLSSNNAKYPCVGSCGVSTERACLERSRLCGA